MILGDYAAARESIESALELGAPKIVNFELGQACLLAGDEDSARRYFNCLPAANSDEREQSLLLAYYWRRLGEAERPSAALISSGLASLRADTAKYAGTAYGEHLSQVIQQLELWQAAT